MTRWLRNASQTLFIRDHFNKMWREVEVFWCSCHISMNIPTAPSPNTYHIPATYQCLRYVIWELQTSSNIHHRNHHTAVGMFRLHEVIGSSGREPSEHMSHWSLQSPYLELCQTQLMGHDDTSLVHGFSHSSPAAALSSFMDFKHNSVLSLKASPRKFLKM